jgi:ankyrin repeat protein
VKPGVAWRATAAAVLVLQAAGPARADIGDADPALRPWLRPAPPAAREGPPDPVAWERRQRPADRLGPPPLRAADRALLEALRAARWADALALGRAGASANARDAQGGHPLVLAAAAGHDDLVRLLLARGAERDRVGEGGFTALGAAAFHGRHSTVRLLLRDGADPARWGSSGQGPLHLAAAAGQLEVLRELLRLGVNPELLNRARESALDVAAAADQQDAMGVLIEAGADLSRAGRR